MRTDLDCPLVTHDTNCAPRSPQAHAKFYDQVYAAVERHFDFDSLKVLIIASPGFVKESVFQHIMDEAVVRTIAPLLCARQQADMLHDHAETEQ